VVDRGRATGGLKAEIPVGLIAAHQVWADVIPKYIENLIAAAGNAGARLVVLESGHLPK
jgi:hypothetical protein